MSIILVHTPNSAMWPLLTRMRKQYVPGTLSPPPQCLGTKLLAHILESVHSVKRNSKLITCVGPNFNPDARL